MLQTTSTPTWICDTCQRFIKTPEGGYIEWIVYHRNGRRYGRSLRLIHHFSASPLDTWTGCQSDPIVVQRRDHGTLYDLSLTDFLGARGYRLLLELLEEKALPTAEVLAMIQRLHGSDYGHLRQPGEHEQSEAVLEFDEPLGHDWPSDVATILQSIDCR